MDCEKFPIKTENNLNYGINIINHAPKHHHSQNSQIQIDSLSTSFDDHIISFSKENKKEHKFSKESSFLVKLNLIVDSLKGITFAFISSLFFSLTTVIVKQLKEVHPSTMASFRFFSMLLFTFPLVTSFGTKIFGNRKIRIFLFARGIAGATSLYLRYSAYQMLPIADATIIILSMPAFVCIFARIFLKESFGVFHLVTLAITLLGIVFTSKLFVHFDQTQLTYNVLGFVCAFGATLIGSATYVIVRKLKDTHHSLIIFNFAWIALFESVIINCFIGNFRLPDCGSGPWSLVLLGILSFYGHFFLTFALQNEEAALVSMVRGSAELIFAFFFQTLFFKEIPDKYSIIGAILITLSVILTGLRKWFVMMPQSNILHKFFSVVF